MSAAEVIAEIFRYPGWDNGPCKNPRLSDAERAGLAALDRDLYLRSIEGGLRPPAASPWCRPARARKPFP